MELNDGVKVRRGGGARSALSRGDTRRRESGLYVAGETALVAREESQDHTGAIWAEEVTATAAAAAAAAAATGGNGVELQREDGVANEQDLRRDAPGETRTLTKLREQEDQLHWLDYRHQSDETAKPAESDPAATENGGTLRMYNSYSSPRVEHEADSPQGQHHNHHHQQHPNHGNDFHHHDHTFGSNDNHRCNHSHEHTRAHSCGDRKVPHIHHDHVDLEMSDLVSEDDKPRGVHSGGGSCCDGHAHTNHGVLSAFVPHGHSFSTHRGANLKLLFLALGALLAVSAGLFAGSLVGRSHALRVEAVHTLIDSLSVVLAILASTLARKAPTSLASFGYVRAEVIAGLLSIVVLFLLCGMTAAGSVIRIASILRHTAEDSSAPVGKVLSVSMAVAVVANTAVTIILSFDSDGNINIRAARAHAIADAVENIVVLLAGLVLMLKPQWHLIDPVLSLCVVTLIFCVNFSLLRDAIHILMEFAPGHIDTEAARAELERVPGVGEVVAMHWWSISPDCVVGAAVLQLGRASDSTVAVRVEHVIDAAQRVLKSRGASEALVHINT
mmetsp:Transcript_11379/g.30651  ORF Transcript_11379/g.30651 Transcript_11379/m.30651 type:complete len:558 (+) Transcript_11379:117-1790(+)